MVILARCIGKTKIRRKSGGLLCGADGRENRYPVRNAFQRSIGFSVALLISRSSPEHNRSEFRGALPRYDFLSRARRFLDWASFFRLAFFVPVFCILALRTTSLSDVDF
uniref:Uncharacterized protein n=1 Tax=Candidatus Kentrum sp. LFY TaxID=2126342 RepID=A0A450WCK0_9GAMM|nr:MAG: hypothetical protein BECKLFY1418C_GA0070996_10117 [Candidatus Kentron sp. LFY]